MKPSRYFALVLLNVFGWYLLGTAALHFQLLDDVPEWLVLSVVASWGFPMVPLLHWAPPPEHNAVKLLALVSVPLLWAAVVEGILRRFVDPPSSPGEGKNSDPTESREECR